MKPSPHLPTASPGPPHSTKRRPWGTTWLVAALLALVAAGCSTPDLKPFADSTATMNAAVHRGQQVFVSELEAIKKARTNVVFIDNSIAEFNKHWSNRIAVMDAMVEYSETLAAAADAPRHRAENTKAVADAVAGLAEKFGPYGAAFQSGLDIVRQVDGLVATVRATRTLRRATAATHPIITNIVPILVKDFQDIHDVLDIDREAMPGFLSRPHADALEARKNILKLLGAAEIRLTDTIVTNGHASVTNFVAVTADANRALADMDRWYLPLTTAIQETDARLAASLDFCRGAQRGFTQWENTHAALARDLKENRQPNWRLLMETANEIKQDIERLQRHE